LGGSANEAVDRRRHRVVFESGPESWPPQVRSSVQNLGL